MTPPMDGDVFQRSPFDPRGPLLPVQGSRVVLHDVTLREGEQAAPVAFSVQDRVAIARALDHAGVPRIQVGFAGLDDEAAQAVKLAGIHAALSSLCVVFDDHWQKNIEAGARSGVDLLLLLFRASDAHLSLAGFTREQGLQRVTAAVAFARERVDTVVFQPSFATTADPAYVLELCAAAAGAGAHEVAVADTVGVATPEGVTRMVSRLRDAIAVPVGVHLHDDYGLALANSVAALRAGATVVEVSVLGLGERAGNCALEELALVLEGMYGVPTGVDLAQLTPLARAVAARAGVPIPAWKSVVGEDVFTQKLDIHVRATARAPRLLEPFDPALVGQERALKLGRGSGPFAVRAKLKALGRRVPDEVIPSLVAFVNERALEQKGIVTDEQFLGAARGLGVDVEPIPGG